MDPLSIVVSASQLSGICLKVSTALYQFIGSAADVNDHLADLKREIDGLGRVLSAIGNSNQDGLKNTPRKSAAGLDELWGSFDASLESCKVTLEKLEKRFGNVTDKTGILGRTGRAGLQLRLEFQEKDIMDYRQQIHSHMQVMQLALTSITVSLRVKESASSVLILEALQQLSLRIEELHKGIPSAPSSKFSREITVKERLVENTKQWHSNLSVTYAPSTSSSIAKTVVETTPVQIKKGGLFKWLKRKTAGKSREQSSKTPTDEKKVLKPVKPITESEEEPPPLPVDEPPNEFDIRLAQKVKHLALSNFLSCNLEKAEMYFTELLSFSNASDDERFLPLLGLCRAHLQQWTAVEEMMPALELNRSRPGAYMCHLLYTIALHEFSLSQSLKKSGSPVEEYVDRAFDLCRETITPKENNYEKHSFAYAKSMNLLYRIYKERGEIANANACLEFIPKELRHANLDKPADYVVWAVKFEQKWGYYRRTEIYEDDTSTLEIATPSPTFPPLQRVLWSDAKSQGNAILRQPPSRTSTHNHPRVPLRLAIFMGWYDVRVAYCIADPSDAFSAPQIFESWPTSKNHSREAKLQYGLHYAFTGEILGWGSFVPDTITDENSPDIDLCGDIDTEHSNYVFFHKTLYDALVDFYQKAISSVITSVDPSRKHGRPLSCEVILSLVNESSDIGMRVSQNIIKDVFQGHNVKITTVLDIERELAYLMRLSSYVYSFSPGSNIITVDTKLARKYHITNVNPLEAPFKTTAIIPKDYKRNGLPVIRAHGISQFLRRKLHDKTSHEKELWYSGRIDTPEYAQSEANIAQLEKDLDAALDTATSPLDMPSLSIISGKFVVMFTNSELREAFEDYLEQLADDVSEAICSLSDFDKPTWIIIHHEGLELHPVWVYADLETRLKRILPVSFDDLRIERITPDTQAWEMEVFQWP